MQVQGVHGVAKALLLSPSQQSDICNRLGVSSPTTPHRTDNNGIVCATKLGRFGASVDWRSAWANPSRALSQAIRRERQHARKHIALYTRVHWQRHSKNLFDAQYDAGPLGLKLCIARYSGRECVHVAESFEECPYWPDAVRPRDELVAINGRLLIEPNQENFVCILNEISQRPVLLTFAQRKCRDRAFANQQRKRHHRQLASSQNVGDKKPSQREQVIQMARSEALNIVSLRKECPCFEPKLGFELRNGCHLRGFDVDANAILAAAERIDLSTGSSIQTTHIRRGDFVRVVGTPRLGWYGGLRKIDKCVEGVMPVDHASIGVVTSIETRKYNFAVASVCFSSRLQDWKADVADLEAIFPPIVPRAPDVDFDLVAAQEERRQEERRQSAYIFQAHPDQQRVDQARPIIQNACLLLMEDERAERPRKLVGSVHAAHVELVTGKRLDIFPRAWGAQQHEMPQLTAVELCRINEDPSEFTDLFDPPQQGERMDEFTLDDGALLSASIEADVSTFDAPLYSRQN